MYMYVCMYVSKYVCVHVCMHTLAVFVNVHIIVCEMLKQPYATME